MGVLRKIEGSFKEDSRMFQECFKRVSSKIKNCFEGVFQKESVKKINGGL